MNFDDDDDDYKSQGKKKKSRERGGKEHFDPGIETPPMFGDRPPRRDFGGGQGGGFGDRPPRRDFGGGQGGGFGDRPPRRDFGGGQGGGFGDRPPRRDFGGGQGGGFGDRPPRRDFGGGQGGGFGDRPPRRDFGGGQGGGFGDRPPRRDFGGGQGGGYGDRPPRRDFGDRPPREAPDTSNLPVVNGTVKFFNGERGFGFVSPDDGSPDVFVHISAVQRSGHEALEPNQRISFQLLPDKFGKGPKAINLKVLDTEASDAPSAELSDDGDNIE